MDIREFELNYSKAFRNAKYAAICRKDKAAIAEFNRIAGKDQRKLTPSEKSFVIRWYLRSCEG